MPQEETFEKQEARAGKEATPQTTISSLSPDEVVMPSLPSLGDDFQQFQDLIKWVVDALRKISAEGEYPAGTSQTTTGTAQGSNLSFHFHSSLTS